MSSRSVATLGMFTALVAALGFLMSGVPNMELMTLGSFVSGALLGSARAVVVGGAAMGIYSAFNPYGMAPPPTFLMQILGCAGVGAIGGVLAGGPRFERLRSGVALAAGALVGFAVTLFYDVLTNIGTAWSTGLDLVPVLVGGVTFGIWHMVWNAVFFAAAGPPLLAALRRRRARAI